VFEFTYDGPGIAKGGNGVLKVDGNVVAPRKIPRTVAFLWPRDETFDVGIDTRTAVEEKDYQVPFAFNGKISKLTFKLGPEQMVAEDAAKVRAAARKPD
jgi:arylsulfatase